MLAGLKYLEDAHVSAIITVADDGGSTGRIRDVYNIPAMGDIRHVLCAMADDNEDLFAKLMGYRFAGDEDVGGHQLGNLIFLALMDITGSFMGAIQSLSKVLKVNGNVLPSTLDNAILYALMADGTLVRGEKNIPTIENSIDKVFYQKDVKAYPQALQAIENADLILYGIGSLYTSILPNLIITDIAKAVHESSATKVYFCNAMSQPGETDGYSLEDHVRAIEQHTFKNAVDLVVASSTKIDPEILARYTKEGSRPVEIKEKLHPYRIMERDLVSVDENRRIRHNPQAIAGAVQEILDSLDESQNGKG
jgi:uncharacterized cofD-like protein